MSSWIYVFGWLTMAGVFELELNDHNHLTPVGDFSDMDDDDEYVDVADVRFWQIFFGLHQLIILF